MKTSLSKTLTITVCALALLGFITPAEAGTVTATGDFGGAGSLRAQIASTAAGGTINFAVTGTITLTQGELVVNKNLTITGPGAGMLTVRGNNGGYVFKIAAANLNVTISGLTIANGNSGTEGGAGIRNESTGTVNVTGCAIVNNTTATSPTFIAGGGIDSRTSGTLNVTNCTISGNTAGEGGGLHLQTGPANLVNCTISGNTALEAYGGGISNFQSTLNITHCTIVERLRCGAEYLERDGGRRQRRWHHRSQCGHRRDDNPQQHRRPKLRE